MKSMTPRISKPARALGTVLAVGVTVASLSAARTLPVPSATPKAGGLTFEYVMTSESSNKKQKEMTDMTTTVRMQNGKVRMDYIKGKSPMGQKDGYILITAKPAQFSIVSDKEKQVMVMDAGMFGSGLGAIMNNPMMKVTIKNAKFSYKDMGAGEVILGYKTRRVRVYSGQDMEMKIIGMTQRSSSSDSSDQWIAQGISADVDENALMAWGRSFAAGVKATNEELAAEFAKFENEYGKGGMALRSTIWSTQTDGKGKSTESVIKTEITSLTKGNIDASVFTVPSNYKVIDLSESMNLMKTAMDSASQGDSTSDKGKTPSAGDAIRKGIGGMFKKKPPM